MIEIKGNERFDKLTNSDISTYYRNEEFYFMRSDFLGAFAYWVVAQSPYDTPNIVKALEAFGKYVVKRIEDGVPKKFTYVELCDFICEDVFEALPEIEKLNHPKVSSGVGYENRHNVSHPDFDFIDLCALAKNIFFMLLRERITQS
jgi:hypothetical protein